MKSSETMSCDVIDACCPDLLKPIVKPFIEESVLYYCTLNQSDITNNCNKYFVIQLVVRHDQQCYFIITRSGRVGYSGNEMIDAFFYRDQAVSRFKQIFQEKTGLDWESRYTADPVKGKYTYVIMTRENKEEYEKLLTHKVDLPDQTVELVKMIFDPDNYQQLNDAFKLDLSRAPLGAISKLQISKARKILNELSQVLDQQDHKDQSREEWITDLTSSFYSLIPTKYGTSKLPLIDNKELLDQKTELLDTLDNAEIMGRLQVNGNIVNQYQNLHCQIVPLDPNSSMYNIIYRYLTHNTGHHYNLTLKKAYQIERESENARFSKWLPLHNRQLLWHGSRTVNYVGILSQGLCINPASVVKTGSMFGNGIYFANCSTKSAQYMRANKIGIMLLCEVALGNTLECLAATDIKTLPPDTHSTRGMGSSTPDPNSHITLEDGLIVPLGTLVKTPLSTSLNYDEYIVYDQSQVRIRYLVVVET